MLDDDLARIRSALAQGAGAHVIDAVLEPLASANDPSTIVPLLLMLNDETEADAMWSLVHVAEQFDDATYVRHSFPLYLASSSAQADGRQY